VKLSYQWLSEFVDLTDVSPEELAVKLTNAGLAVDAVVPRNQGISGVVVGLVVECIDHPNADRLHVCKVDVGESELYQIVCGAENVAAGFKFPVALPGTSLPFGVKIKKAKLRGVESNGMLCSAKELGMETRLLPSDQTTGLYRLPNHAQVGEDVVKLLQLDDVVFEVDLTPNRSDCLSIRGFAYEVAAILGKQTTFPDVIELPALLDDRSPLRIQIETERCSHYEGQVIEHVKPLESPLWMQMRLMAMGVRPIDVIVDITNYCMLEWGQPLHAFDFREVHNETIVVRQAKVEESIVTLDGVERTLNEDVTVIADSDRSIGIAGVMGGQNSEITGGTSVIVLESAAFHPAATRRTGQRLGLHSEAQQRFEKGVDPLAIRSALARATTLLIELSGGVCMGGIVSRRSSSESHIANNVAFSPERCNQLLGTEIPCEEMKQIFRRLGFTVTASAEDDWQVLVPTRRPDITIEADLVEEVGRLYGLDTITSTLPVGDATVGQRTPFQVLKKRTRDALIATGMTEVVTYAFTTPEALTGLRLPETSSYRNLIPLLRPMSDERSHLRTHLLPSLAEVARYNLAHSVSGGQIFEIARLYRPYELPISRQPEEITCLAGLWFGQTGQKFGAKVRSYDFYDAKGSIETWLEAMGWLERISYEPSGSSWLHQGRAAVVKLDDTVIGEFGEIHPETGIAYEIPRAIYAEFNLQSLQSFLSDRFLVKSPPRYPASRRDLAVVIAEHISIGQLLSIARSVGIASGNILESAFVFDVYRGTGVPEGKKSVALGFLYQADDRTLTDEEIESVQNQILAGMQKECQAELRA
jgi:phenylalanyl-tRNA synthetase beta chain